MDNRAATSSSYRASTLSACSLVVLVPLALGVLLTLGALFGDPTSSRLAFSYRFWIVGESPNDMISPSLGVQELRELMRSENIYISDAAAVALADRGLQEPLLDALRNGESASERATAATFIRRLDGPVVRQALADALRDERPLVRARAAGSLEAIGTESELVALRLALESATPFEDHRVQRALLAVEARVAQRAGRESN